MPRWCLELGFLVRAEVSRLDCQTRVVSDILLRNSATDDYKVASLAHETGVTAATPGCSSAVSKLLSFHPSIFNV